MKSESHSGVKVNLDNITIVLYKPRFPENVGAAARAAKNMGISKLVLVQPEKPDCDRMLKMATAGAVDLIEHMDIYDDLGTALRSFNYVAGTTARLGGVRQSPITPRDLAYRLIDLSQCNRIALLFGPENWGLTNAELAYCHTLVNIPTTDFSSLNLAQAVLILVYELYLAKAEKPSRVTPQLANSWELETMYERLRETLLKIDYISHQNPDHWMMTVRRFFSRHGLRSAEVQIIRGICRQIDWYTQRRQKDDS